MEMVGIGVVGMAETDTVGTAETGVTCVVGEVAIGISVSAATPGSSRVPAIRRMDMQNKGKP